MRIDLTRSKTYEVAYPYDGNALDTSNILREHYSTHIHSFPFVVSVMNDGVF